MSITELPSNGNIKPNGELIDIVLSPLPRIDFVALVKDDKSLPITLFSQDELKNDVRFTEITSIPKKDSLGWNSAVMSRRRERNRVRFRRGR